MAECEVCGKPTDGYCADCYRNLCDEHIGQGDSYPGEWCQECIDKALAELTAKMGEG